MKRQIIRLFLCFTLVYIHMPGYVLAQDSLKNKKAYTGSYWIKNSENEFLLKNRTLVVPHDAALQEIVSVDKAFRKFTKERKFNKMDQACLKFDHAVLIGTRQISRQTLPASAHLVIRHYFLDDSKLLMEPLYLTGTFGFNARNCEFNYLTMNADTIISMDMDSTVINNQLNIEAKHLYGIPMVSGLRSRTDSLKITISGDTIGGFHVSNTHIKNLHIDVDAKTIRGLDIEPGSYQRVNKPFYDSAHLIIRVSGSALHDGIFSRGCRYPSKIILDDVRFREDAGLGRIGYDTLILKNCSRFDKAVPLSADTGTKILYLSFINTDVTKLDLNFTGRMQLFFEPGVEPDQITNTFENLLAKFTREGKLESLKNVNIQYTIYKNQQYGFTGSCLSFLSKVWWYYGYKKWLIGLWTFGFLLLFFVINAALWKNMKDVYPVVTLNHRAYRRNHSRTALIINHLISIFVFTALIFFSLRVDFSKISFERSRLLLLFFLQYAVGLICTFFIVNAILKFN